MPRQPLVEDRPIGMDEFRDTSILGKHLAEERLRLLRHRPHQKRIKLAIQVRVGRGCIDLPQFEPLSREVLDEALQTLVAKHPVNLGTQHRRLAQFASGGERGQFLIGQRGPEEIRQPRGDGIVIQRARLFAEVEKMRRRKDRLVGAAQRRVEFVALVEPLLKECDVVGECRVVDRPAHRPWEEVAEQSLAVGTRVGRDWNQRVAPPVVVAAVLANLRQRLASTFRFHDARGFQRQIAEQSLVARRRKFAERALQFHQLERESRPGIRLVERLAFELVAHGAFVGQLPGVDADGVELVQHHFELEHPFAVRGRVERRQRSSRSVSFMDAIQDAHIQRQRAIAGVDRLRDDF